MPHPRLADLTPLRTALLAHDRAACEAALQLTLLTPSLLWQACSALLSPADVAALQRAASHSAAPAMSFDRLLQLLPFLHEKAQAQSAAPQDAAGLTPPPAGASDAEPPTQRAPATDAAQFICLPPARDPARPTDPRLATDNPPTRRRRTPGSPAALGPFTNRHALACALGGSEAVSRYLLATPQLAYDLLHDPELTQPRQPAQLLHTLRHLRCLAPDPQAFECAVRRLRVYEWCRLVTRSLGGLSSTPETLLEVSHLANAIVDMLTRYHLRRRRSAHGPLCPPGQSIGFAVVAQGKLGAQELNVSSDVDIQFLCSYAAAAESPQSRAAYEHYTRVAQAVVGALSGRDATGFCYRVDVDLRPEGKKGALVNSVGGAEHYYEAWGQAWERLALMRLRHVGGAAWVTQEFAQAVQPFVYPRSLAKGPVEEIVALRHRALAEQRLSRLGKNRGLNLKKDPGGIREIELFVQVLQLLHAGRQPQLQTASLLLAMERLHFAGLLTQVTYDTLRDAYLLLRSVENAVQAMDERQTHSLPTEAEALAHLAKVLGYRSGAGLSRAMQRTHRQVQRLTRPVFGAGPQPIKSHKTPLSRRLADALGAPCEAQLTALTALGFADPSEAQGVLQALHSSVGGAFSHRAAEALAGLSTSLLADIARSPDPQQALRLYADLDAQLKRQPAYLKLLASTPLLRRRLIDLMGTSEFLGRTIVHFPELIDWFAAARNPAVLLARRAPNLLAEVHRRLAKVTQKYPDEPPLEAKLRSLRRFKLQEQLRIGMLDLAGTISIEDVQAQLSMVAEVCLQACWALAASPEETPGAAARPQTTPLTAAAGRPDAAAVTDAAAPDVKNFCVLAMGRLGGAEMGYGSDLDLLFIYDATATFESRHAVRLAQKIISYLTVRLSEGTLYPIDTRLRPSGSQGPLVSSSTGFVQYHRERAMLWERQALLRARPVAGDLALGEAVLAQLHATRYPQRLPPKARAQTHAMRLRIAATLGRQTDAILNVKAGRGALGDIEFTVQFLLLAYAGHRTTLQQTSTRAALLALGEEHILSAQHARILLRAYSFFRLLEARLRIVHDRPIAAIDFSGTDGERLARRMGFAAGRRPAQRLRRVYEQTTAAVRRVYNLTFKVDC